MNSIEPKKLSILAVDDNQMNLILMKSMFKTSDYDVYYADCGKKAIEMARQNHPDMILLDIVMPDLSGFEVCRILKEEEDFKEVPVIFITAADDLDFMLKGFTFQKRGNSNSNQNTFRSETNPRTITGNKKQPVRIKQGKEPVIFIFRIRSAKSD